MFAYPDINTRGVGRTLDSYAIPSLEFSQPLSCLYQAMQTRKTLNVSFLIKRITVNDRLSAAALISFSMLAAHISTTSKTLREM